MKNVKTVFGLLALLFVIIFPIKPAFPGHPDEDTDVASMREDFKNGTLPSLTQLELGKIWVCETRSAVRGEKMVDKDSEDYKFKEDDAEGKGYVLNELDKNRSFSFVGKEYNMLFNADTKAEVPNYITIRINSRLELIVQVVTVFKEEDDDKAADAIGLKASDAKLKAFIYARCQVKK